MPGAVRDPTILPINTLCVPATICWAMTQSRFAKASSRAGAPVVSSDQLPRSKRSDRSAPSMPANRLATSSWPRARTFKQNPPALTMRSCAPAWLLAQISSCGGSAETEQAAVAVNPFCSPLSLSRAVMTLTLAAS